MNVVICESEVVVNDRVAGILIEAVRQNPSIILGLATGGSPIGVYNNMVKDHVAHQTNYENVQTYNLDEYEGLSGDHPQSYRQFMNQNLFNHLNIKLENTHVPSGLGDLESVCRAYDAAIENAGGIDIQLLGIGTNGHIAFNEPGTPFDSMTHVTHLTENTIEDNARFFDSMDMVPKRAVTMGIKSILKAKKIILIAMGESKAEVINAMINGPVTESVTASALQNHPDVTVFIDQEAASLLVRSRLNHEL